MNRVIYKSPEGGIAVIIPTGELLAEGKQTALKVQI